MGPLYRSNEFCSMVGTTRNTLRYYLESGLLSPELVNESGYTFYGEREALQMMMLQLYRSCNLSVDGVKEFMWTMDLPTQSRGLDSALEDLDEQIRQLQRKRNFLARRCEVLHRCLNQLNQPFLDESEAMRWGDGGMYILNLHETVEHMGEKGIALIREMAHRLPQTHISLMADWQDFVARREMPVKLGYGLVWREGEKLEGLDLSLFHKIPAHRCIVVRVRVKDPLFLTPEDLQPLYDEVERLGCRVVNGVFGHLLSMEQENGTFYYYIAMRVHIE